MFFTIIGFAFACVCVFQFWLFALARFACSENENYSNLKRKKVVVYTCPECKHMILSALWRHRQNLEVLAIVQIDERTSFWKDFKDLMNISYSLATFHLYSYISADFLMYASNRIYPPFYSFVCPTIPVPFDLRKETYDRSKALIHLRNLTDIEDSICVSFAGPLLPKEFLQLHKLCLNAHAGILPINKGASPEFWSCVVPKLKAGYSIHEMVVAIDAGPIVKSKVVSDLASGYFEMFVQLRLRIAQDFAELLVNLPEDGEVAKTPQRSMLKRPNPNKQDIEKAMKLPKFSFNPMIMYRSMIRILTA